MKRFVDKASLISAVLLPGQYVETYNTTGTDKLGARYFIENAGYTHVVAEGDIVLVNGSKARFINTLNRSLLINTDKVQNISSITGGLLTNVLNWINGRLTTLTNTTDTLASTIADTDRTGDLKTTFNSTIYAGWIKLDGLTIGSATSGATNRANTDTEALFLYLWDYFDDSEAPVIGGRGASAAADWSANKEITLISAEDFITHFDWDDKMLYLIKL